MSAELRQRVPLESVVLRLRELRYPEVEGVVAIERGGLVAGKIVATVLNVPLSRIRLRYRDDSNEIRHAEPEVVGDVEVQNRHPDRILLVDDVCVTGATMRRAQELLPNLSVTTLVLLGEADLVAFPEFKSCVTWPWSPQMRPGNASVEFPNEGDFALDRPLASRTLEPPIPSVGSGSASA